MQFASERDFIIGTVAAPIAVSALPTCVLDISKMQIERITGSNESICIVVCSSS